MRRIFLGFWSAALALVLPHLSLASDPVVVFGLTNVPLGQAILMGNVVTNLSSKGLDGVSILLGEADAGVFAYPATMDNPDGGDYMRAKVYGKLNGVPDQLLCTVRGRKVDGPNGFGVYPVSTDFSPLGVTNFLGQVFSRNGALVAQQEIGLEESVVRTDYNGYAVTRVNPFWRAPDGGIAVVLEFPGSTGLDLLPRPKDQFIPFGTRFVLRALNPTGVVEYVSRVDITTGGLPPEKDKEGKRGEGEGYDGLTTFHMSEVRPGFFGRPHKALGDVAFQARGGVVKIARLNPDQPESENDFVEGTGVHVEWERASGSGIDFQPVDLSASNAQFGVTALMQPSGAFWYFSTWSYVLGTARLRQTTNGLKLTGVFEHLGTNAQQVRLAVYQAGELVGMSPALDLDNNVFPTVAISGNPRVLRAGAQGNTMEALPGLGFTFDATVTFATTNGGDSVSFTGDEVKFLSVGPIYLEFPLTELWLERVAGILINSRGLADFTITGERQTSLVAPALSITQGAGQVKLSWPDPNRAYYVQASTVVESGYASGPYPDYTHAIAVAYDIVSTNEARFYRLLHNGAVD